MSQSPFEDPADFTGIDYAGIHGSLLMFQVNSFEDHVHTIHTKPGEKNPAVRVDLTILDGAQAGTTITDALVFPKVLVGQLRSKVGKLVLGRLVQGEARQGMSPPWRLEPASAQDRAMAEAALNRSRITGPASTPAPTASAAPPF